MPYHRLIVDLLRGRAAHGACTVLISLHSFTPCLLACPSPRPWQVGLCYRANNRFTGHVLKALDRYEDLNVGRNEPYGVDLDVSYSIPVYGEEQRSGLRGIRDPPRPHRRTPGPDQLGPPHRGRPARSLPELHRRPRAHDWITDRSRLTLRAMAGRGRPIRAGRRTHLSQFPAEFRGIARSAARARRRSAFRTTPRAPHGRVRAGAPGSFFGEDALVQNMLPRPVWRILCRLSVTWHGIRTPFSG